MRFDAAIHPRAGPAAALVAASPEGARSLLATIAGSAITVAGLIFSITMVVLTMASAQFGPRLLRNFMMHNATQLVLGTFLATFVYCLVVLAAVRGGPDGAFVPQTAVAAGLVLGVSGFALLIYFFHHVSVFVQAPGIIESVASSLEATLRAEFPERPEGRAARDAETADDGAVPPEDGASPVDARASGYVEAIDLDGLARLAAERGLVIRLRTRAGAFAVAGRPLADVHPRRAADDAVRDAVAAAIFTGPQRTGAQDPEFAVRQLVEVALRALSPSINDPFTAIHCIDRLGAALVLLGGRELPSRYVRDEAGAVRVITEPLTFGHVVNAALGQIRPLAAGTPAVALRLLEVVRIVAAGELPPDGRAALREQVEAMQAENRGRFASAADRRELESRLIAAFDALDRPRT